MIEDDLRLHSTRFDDWLPTAASASSLQTLQSKRAVPMQTGEKVNKNVQSFFIECMFGSVECVCVFFFFFFFFFLMRQLAVCCSSWLFSASIGCLLLQLAVWCLKSTFWCSNWPFDAPVGCFLLQLAVWRSNWLFDAWNRLFDAPWYDQCMFGPCCVSDGRSPDTIDWRISSKSPSRHDCEHFDTHLRWIRSIAVYVATMCVETQSHLALESSMVVVEQSNSSHWCCFVRLLVLDFYETLSEGALPHMGKKLLEYTGNGFFNAQMLKHFWLHFKLFASQAPIIGFCTFGRKFVLSHTLNVFWRLTFR